jgi:hypothetical protein
VQRSARDGFPDSGRCDGVIVGWGAYSLLHGRSTRVAFLAGARAALPIGAPVLLSHYERVADDRELRWTHAISRRLRALRGAAPTELGDTFAPNLAHVFTRAELAEELRASGFEPVASLTVGQADQTTQYGCAVARAT